MTTSAENPSLFLLLDSCVVAGYYAPSTLQKRPQARDRIKIIIDAVKKCYRTDIKLLIPNVCVAEAFTVLSKYANVRWQGKPKKKVKGAIHGKSYGGMRRQFATDIHNGSLIEQVELNRYHLLARHFVSAVDHQTPMLRMQRSDAPGSKSKKTINALSATDQLIGGMAIWLSRLLGEDRFRLVTSDYRMVKILRKGRKVTVLQARQWGLDELAKEIDIPWSPDVFPHVIDLENDSDKSLRAILGIWPLPTRSTKKRKAKVASTRDIAKLVKLYQDVGIARDRLPYTDKMKVLTKAFCIETGLDLPEQEVWKLLIGRLKQGKGKLKP